MSSELIVIEDDNEAHVSYHPPDAWENWARANPAYHADSYHVTMVAGAHAVFAFNGSYVEYHSDSNYDHGAFLVSIDGKPPVALTSHSAAWSGSPIALFTAPLPDGPHTLNVTNIDDGKYTGCDFFVYRAAVQTVTVTVSSATPPPLAHPDPRPHAHPPMAGATLRLILGILGLVSGVLIGLLAIAVSMFYRKTRASGMRIPAAPPPRPKKPGGRAMRPRQAKPPDVSLSV